MLCDLGADIIKVEPPSGDPTRHVSPAPSPIFAALNFGKRSIALDLKAEAAVEAVKTIIASVDVVVESFRPGVMERLGLGYDALRQLNPGVVLCSISGYGQDGPEAQTAGHDLNFLARAGILSIAGPKHEVPAVPPVQMADMAGGSYPAVVGILGALLERDQRRRQNLPAISRHLDIAITRQCVQLMVLDLPRRLGGEHEGRGDGMLTGGLPCYRLYETKDQKYMALGALEPKFFQRFCQIVGLAAWQDDGLAGGARGEQAHEAISKRMRQRSQRQWTELLAGEEVCCEPVVDPIDAYNDPRLMLRRVSLEGGHTTVGSDFGVPMPGGPHPVPEIGGDTQAILEEFSVPAAVVEALT